MFKVDNGINYKEVVEAFSKNYYKFCEELSLLKGKVENVSLKNKTKKEIETDMRKLNEKMGDYMDIILKTVKKTDLAKVWIDKDNDTYRKNGIDEIYGFSELKNRNDIIEEALFHVFEEGMCARVSFFSNICFHTIDESVIEQMMEKIGINKATIDRNRQSKKGEKDKRSTLYNAIIELEKQKIHLKMIDKALKNPNDKSSKEVINSVRDVMKNVCSIKDFSKSNIKDFVKTIKCYNLRYGLLDAKFLGFKGMLYNLKAKDILAQQINGNITEDEYKALKPEVLFGYVTENKKVSKSKINGQDSVRIVIKGKDDIGSMQFHLQKKDVLDALKDYNMEIEENEKLEDAVSISVPYSNEKGKEYVKNNRGDLGWETIENFENFDKNTFMEITNKMVKKLALITKLNKEKKGEKIKI